jgi:hypothetical protein
MQLPDNASHAKTGFLWGYNNTVVKVGRKSDDRMDDMRINDTRVYGTDDFAAIAAGAVS